jgi:hypothetical protein
MKSSGRCDVLRVRRDKDERFIAGKSVVLLRDQRPLYQGNMELPKEFTFQDFVELLNGKVFFWPGDHKGPIDYGERHFHRYQKGSSIILRCFFRSLILENVASEPLFSGYNSGSPRCWNGKKSPRGPDTFLKAHDFKRSPSEVVEVVFDGQIVLPADTELGDSTLGCWEPLFNKS